MSIQIDCDFPGGNIILARIEGDTVFLNTDLRDTEGDWFYWYFRITGAAGRKLVFQFLEGGRRLTARGPGLSRDGGQSWEWLSRGHADEKSFTYVFDAAEDDMRFCVSHPYLQANFEHFLKSLGNNPSLQKEILCVTKKGREVERLRLGRLDGKASLKMLITARHHCCEMIADHAQEGIIEAILGDDEIGAWFRDKAEIIMIPFIDKDGVEDGDQGKNRRPRDHNRDYDPPHIHIETAALKKFVEEEWAPGGADLALDLHCPTLRGEWNEQIYIVGGADPENRKREERFRDILADGIAGPLPFDREHGYLPSGQGWNNPANYTQGMGFKNWSLSLPETGLTCTFEIPYGNAQGVEVNADSARAFGRDLACAVMKYFE